MNYILESEGISTLLQCIMIPKSRKINQSAYVLLSKMIQVLTYSNHDSTFIGP